MAYWAHNQQVLDSTLTYCAVKYGSEQAAYTRSGLCHQEA